MYHDTCHANDVRCNHLFVTSAVCRPVRPDPADHSPLDSLEGHKCPEVRAMRVVRDIRPRPEPRDYADRWIDMVEKACAMSLMHDGW